VVSPLPKPPKANTTSGLLIESACGGAGSIRRPEQSLRLTEQLAVNTPC
jgi:hypothetical protein